MRFRCAVPAAIFLLAATLRGQDTSLPVLSLVWHDANPNQSSTHAISPNSASGGRVNGLAMSRDKSLAMAASEWGGLWSSLDTGRTWHHVDAHLPSATWQVAIEPDNARQVYATSFYDGRVHSLAGINVSSDGGRSWTHPPTSDAAPGACADSGRVQNPSAFGIAISPTNPKEVLVGTNCGLIRSTDSGVTWRRVYPPEGKGRDVWSVVIHGPGIIDLCGDLGHSRSIDGGAHWSHTVAAPLPGGQCSIASAPGNANVLIATVNDTLLYESRDGGVRWSAFSALTNHPDSEPGRISWVGTNARSNGGFDLWYGYAKLLRGTCEAEGCPVLHAVPLDTAAFWHVAGLRVVNGRFVGAHLDVGVVLFDPADSVNACPLLLSNDGGIERNALTASPACQAPHWVQPDITPHALWVLGMKLTQALSRDSTVHEAGGGISAVPFDRVNTYHRIIIGTQDNGSFQTDRADADTVRWQNTDPADATDVDGDKHVTLNSVCCFADGVELFLRVIGKGDILSDTAARRLLPPPGTEVLYSTSAISMIAPYRFAILTDRGVFVSHDVRVDSAWTALGWPVANLGIGTLAALSWGVDSAGPTVFVRIDSAGAPSQLWRRTGLRILEAEAPSPDPTALGAWERVIPPGDSGGFGVVAVDRADAKRLFVSNVREGKDPRMARSNDGGKSWTLLPALDVCMTRNGRFRYSNVRGPTGIGTGKPGFGGYSQPTLVAFGTDADSGRLLLAGAADAGIFLSFDAGESWKTLTDPFTPQRSGIPLITRAMYVKVVSDLRGTFAYFGSQGRGVWATLVPRASPTAVVAPSC